MGLIFEEEEESFTDKEVEDFGRLFGLHVKAEKEVRLEDLVAQASLEAWDRGFDAALELLRERGAVDIAGDLKKLRDAYWRTQGVD